MKRTLMCVLSAMVIGLSVARAQAPSGPAIQRLDPALDKIVSPDEKYLYVGGGRRITRYQVQPDGTITNGHVFVDMSADKAPGGADGMKVDRNGNVYSTGPGGVWIISPEGKHLGTILVPAANLAFGDADSKTLHLTARRDLYRIRMNIPGIRP